MRIPNSSFFPVKIDFKCAGRRSRRSEFQIYDSTFKPVNSNRIINDSIDTLTLTVMLPQKLAIKTPVGSDQYPIELIGLSVAGIKVTKNKLLSCIEYKSTDRDLDISTADQIINLPSIQTLTCQQPGYVILNLFHPNPFAWHLYIGNTIRF